MMLLKFALKNVFSRKSSFVIIFFVTFAIMLFCVSNAVFDSTENGVRTTYISSFTGDILLRPKSSTQLSLFGDETPVTGELTEINRLVPYSDIVNFLKSQNYVENCTPQVSTMSALDFKKKKTPLYIFGVDGSEYVDIMSSIKILEGEPFTLGQKGAMICDRIAENLGISLGDTIQFVVPDGPNYKIRSAPVTAIYTYEIYNDIFERFVLLDADTVRTLANIDSGNTVKEEDIAEENKYLLGDDLDIDSLFDSFDDVDAIWDENVENPFENKSDEAVVESSQTEYVPSNSWNFLIIRLKSGTNTGKTIRKLNRYFKKKNWPVQAADWRHAAGSVSLYLYWMRIIFNIGISIVLIAGLIIVNNTLVVNVLDRTQEIGTLRAIGTSKIFISLECMIETFIMTLISGAAGVILSKIICYFITKAHIVLGNSFLIQLFGGDALNIFVSIDNIFKMFLLVVFLAVAGWIYPVINALKITPVQAMQGGR